jgi:TPP-dependent indolepyruvate ferredoxin oxidoreductase alpha subunit
VRLNEIKCVTVISTYHNAEIQAIIKRGKEKKKPLCIYIYIYMCVCERERERERERDLL